MIALLLAQVLAVPANLAALPELRFTHPVQQAPEASAFVRDEVGARRCTAATRAAEGWTLKVDVAVLAASDGQVRRTIPGAIGCATVEQYAAGLASAMARGNVVPGEEGWYRTSLIFAWRE